MLLALMIRIQLQVQLKQYTLMILTTTTTTTLILESNMKKIYLTRAAYKLIDYHAQMITIRHGERIAIIKTITKFNPTR